MAEPVVQPDDDLGRYSLFFPIKVVNGFVTCDFKVGCYSCKFCLNRRYPDWERMLATGRVYRNALQIPQALALLHRVKALTAARVTLKLGHDTDMSLEESEAQALVAGLPADQPIVFMRRGRLLPQHRAFYLQDRPNLLMELTLTPRSRELAYHLDPFAILDSFAGIACNVFYTVGPVCEDNYDEAKAILRAIPPGSQVWVRELIVKDIPTLPQVHRTDYGGEALRRFARDQGHTVISYLNCVVRSRLGLRFHKRGEFVSEPNPWQLDWADRVCPVRDACGREEPEELERAAIHQALADLGLSLAQPLRKFAHKSYAVITREEVNFGDECYLRERTSLKIDLWKEGYKTGTALSRSIAERWKAVDFFPVEEMLELARESFALVERAMRQAPAPLMQP